MNSLEKARYLLPRSSRPAAWAGSPRRPGPCVLLLCGALIATAVAGEAHSQTWAGGAPVSQSWYPQGRASLSATSSSSRTALPAAGQIANVCNTGTADAYVQTGDVTVVATTAASYLVKVGTCKPLQINAFVSRDTYLAGITSSGTAALIVETGVGTPPKDDASSTAGGTSTLVPSSAAAAGIPPVVSSALESCHILKSGAGNLYSLGIVVQATSGVVQLFDATSAPADGAVAPVWAQSVLSNGTYGGGSWAWPASAPAGFATGITVCFSSATTPFTKTASATALFSGGAK